MCQVLRASNNQQPTLLSSYIAVACFEVPVKRQKQLVFLGSFEESAETSTADQLEFWQCDASVCDAG
jgi:hypothetical protein